MGFTSGERRPDEKVRARSIYRASCALSTRGRTNKNKERLFLLLKWRRAGIGGQRSRSFSKIRPPRPPCCCWLHARAFGRNVKSFPTDDERAPPITSSRGYFIFSWLAFRYKSRRNAAAYVIVSGRWLARFDCPPSTPETKRFVGNAPNSRRRRRRSSSTSYFHGPPTPPGGMGGKYSKMDPNDVNVPQLDDQLDRDPYLKPYEREFKRR